MRLIACCCLFTMSCVSLVAQVPPYDQAPEVAPPYYRVRYEAGSQPGELIFPVTYTVWIPDGVKALRGVVVHQHGCGEGSCKSGQTGAFDLHWQALAAAHDCALLAPSYEQPQAANCQMWCDPRNGSDKRFQQALTDLGQRAGHPELATVPWALWGHSGGGHWAGGMLLLHPERVAAVWLRSGVPLFEQVEGRAIEPHASSPASWTVPVMCNFGTKEGYTVTDGRFSGVWPANRAFFRAMRGNGALIAIAVDPLSSHECGNQRYLAIPWMDACLNLRLPAEAGDPMRPVDASNGVTVRWNAKSPDTAEEKTETYSLWLPNQSIADAWSQYIDDTAVGDPSDPPPPTNVELTGDVLTWHATADLESGIARFVVERDGEVIATVPEQPQKSFGRPLFQGLQYSDTPLMPLVKMRCQVPPVEPGQPNPYRVRAVNTVGRQSELR